MLLGLAKQHDVLVGAQPPIPHRLVSGNHRGSKPPGCLQVHAVGQGVLRQKRHLHRIVVELRIAEQMDHTSLQHRSPRLSTFPRSLLRHMAFPVSPDDRACHFQPNDRGSHQTRLPAQQFRGFVFTRLGNEPLYRYARIHNDHHQRSRSSRMNGADSVSTPDSALIAARSCATCSASSRFERVASSVSASRNSFSNVLPFIRARSFNRATILSSRFLTRTSTITYCPCLRLFSNLATFSPEVS